VKLPDSWRQVKRRGALRDLRRVRFGMSTIPVLALIADTLLVRPVAVPAPWYSVATGILSIVVTVLLLGIAAALLAMARAVRGAEHNLGKRFEGLSDELIPLVRNLNRVATQLSDVTTAVRQDLGRLSGTVGAVDDAVRDALDAGQQRLSQLATLVDVVQDEAEETIAAATGLMRGVRTGAGTLFADVIGRDRPARQQKARRGARRDGRATAALDESDVRARLAALEAAFASGDADDEDDDDEEVVRTARARAKSAQRSRREDPADSWDDDEDDLDLADEDTDDVSGDADDDDDDALDDAGDDADRDLDDDDELGDDEDDEMDDDDDNDEDDDVGSGRPPAADAGPRSGGPRIRRRRPG
jgi:hypothetical protein